MIGTTISHYKILEKLGEGGMGVVYKAHDLTLDRTVALKFLPHYLTSDENEKERFFHEARAASALNHPNITTIHEMAEHDNQLYMAMELVEGKTLKKLVHEELPPVKKVLDIAIQIGDGLTAAHEKNVVHRDIKSDNIMLTPKGQVKIMDFGLAKVKGATKLTKEGSTIGTAAYMSPEQAQGEDVDHRSDIFSFGVVLYELLSGNVPFKGEHQAALMYSLINEDPPPIARFNDKVSPDLQRIVDKALAKDKSERYQHMDDMLADLRKERKSLEYAITGYVKGPATRQSVAASGQPKGKTKKKIFIIGGIVAVVGVAAYLFTPLYFSKVTGSASEEDRRSIAVLPFTNLNDSKEDESFCDGMTEDILTQLSKIGDLKVISRSSIMRYKGTQKTSREIGKELGVATILEGSIRRAGDRLRITGQLIDAGSDEQIWADNYDRDMKDVFAIQSDVAISIARALQANFSAAEQARIEQKPTESIEAYGLYTKGRQYYYLYHQNDNERAIELFRKAVGLDPNYALAYAGLGDCYAQRVSKFGFAVEWVDSGIAAGQKAVTLDPNLAEGYKALGLCYDVKGFLDRSLDSYSRAIERNPNYAPAIANSSIINTKRGNLAEAYRWAVKGATLSAVEPFLYLERGYVYYFLGEDEKAEQWMKKSQDMQPDFLYASLGLCRLYVGRGDFQKARTEVKKALSVEPDDPGNLIVAASIELWSENYDPAAELFRRTLSRPVELGGDASFRSSYAGLGFSLIRLGKTSEGTRLLDEIRARHEKSIQRGNDSPILRYELAAIAAAEGKGSEALDWLNKATGLGWRDYRLTRRDPMFGSLRNDDRFKKLTGDMEAKISVQAGMVHQIENKSQ
jgi:serine/threonine protein kinase/tetratricopeptide (TPR) repeat protein